MRDRKAKDFWKKYAETSVTDDIHGLMNEKQSDEARREAEKERKRRNSRDYRERKKLAEKGEPLRKYDKAECGTPAMYKNGCRCKWCTAANTIDCRLRNQERRLRDANSGDSEASQSDV